MENLRNFVEGQGIETYEEFLDLMSQNLYHNNVDVAMGFMTEEEHDIEISNWKALEREMKLELE